MTATEPTTHRGERRRLLLIAAFAAIVDWSTKLVASVTLDDGPVSVGSLLTLRLGHNPGVAFGVGDRLPGPLVIGVTAAVTAVLAFMAVRGQMGPWWAAGPVLGGAVANVGDRLIGGTVVDFLDLGWWPSFNLADVFLTVGSALLILASLRSPGES